MPKAPPINQRLPELIEMRSRLSRYFSTEFPNCDGLTLTLAQWLYAIIEAPPRPLGVSRECAIARNLKAFGIPPSIRRGILNYDRLRGQIFAANRGLCMGAVAKNRYTGMLGRDVALSIADSELLKAIDDLDLSKGLLSTLYMKRVGPAIDKFAERRSTGLTGIRQLREIWNDANAHHRLAVAAGLNVTLDAIGAALAGGHTQWEQVRQGTKSSLLVPIDENLLKAKAC